MAPQPTFSSLILKPTERTPRRKPVLDHLGVITNTVNYLQNKRGWQSVETEMQLPWVSDMKKHRQADVVAWNRHEREFYLIECKASWNDFQRDMKFMECKRWCTWMAFAVPEELATAARIWMDEHDGPRAFGGVGLLVIPNDYTNRRMVRRPKRRPMNEQMYGMMVEQWAASCRSRLVGARMKITELEYTWKNRNILRDLEARRNDAAATAG